MRYLIALIIGIAVLFGVYATTGVSSLPRPWGSLLMGGTVGVTMVVTLLIWEVVKPSSRTHEAAKPAMSDEERARAREDRRARLAAEAGVSWEDTDPHVPKIDETETEATGTSEDSETSADAEGSEDAETSKAPADAEGVEGDSNDERAEHLDNTEQDAGIEAEADSSEPNPEDDDEFPESGSEGSSLETSPTGEPGEPENDTSASESRPEVLAAPEEASEPDVPGAKDAPADDEPSDRDPK